MAANGIFVVREASGYGPEVISALITGIFILLAAIIGYKFGLRTYFRKREHEQIMKRYLEEGIDRAKVSIEHAVGVFTDNNRTALSVVRALIQKEAGLRIEEKDYSPSFRKYEQQYFDSIPFVKIQRLIGDTIFWKSAQLLYAFVDGKSNWFENDFRITVKNVIEGTIDISQKALLDMTRKTLKGYFEDSKKYLYILLRLESIANILEKESNITWSKLGEFKHRSDIKNIVQTLKDKFAEDLKRIEQKGEEEKELRDKQKQ